MATQPQNLSREMILPAYMAAISLGLPILPTQHHIRKNRASRIENPATYVPIRHSTSVENPLQIHPFLYKRTQSCPPPADSKPFIWQRLTKKQALRQHPKTNPNEPKTNPIFRSSGPPKAKTNPNEPKTNPISQKPKNQRNLLLHKGLRQYPRFRVTKNKPNLSRRSHGEAGTNPIPKTTKFPSGRQDAGQAVPRTRVIYHLQFTIYDCAGPPSHEASADLRFAPRCIRLLKDSKR
jgi:hypothetical protein